MPKSKVAVGYTAGALTVLEPAGMLNHRNHWYCECSKCGTWHLLSSQQLVRNKPSDSCSSCTPDDLVGNTYGRLTVSRFSHRRNNRMYWLCRCSCGNEHVVARADLISGKTKSCGCLNVELSRERQLIHGGLLYDTPSPEYLAWFNLRHNGKTAYPDNWEDFRQFIKDVGFKPDDTYTLSRHDLRKPHSMINTYWRNADDEREQQRSLGLSRDCAIDMSTV